jgi:hypothetical protein
MEWLKLRIEKNCCQEHKYNGTCQKKVYFIRFDGNFPFIGGEFLIKYYK